MNSTRSIFRAILISAVTTIAAEGQSTTKPAGAAAPATKPTAPALPLPLAERTGSGISGPGAPFSADGPVYRRRKRPESSAVKSGLIPDIKPVMDLHVRDTVIRVGGDGQFYMTGSTGDDIWVWNEGVELWRSPDLQKWEYLGVVWSTLKDGTWEKTPMNLHGKGVVTIWAPEFHYLKSKTTTSSA